MDVINDETLYGTVENFKANWETDFSKQDDFKSILAYLQDRNKRYDKLWELMSEDMDKLQEVKIRDEEWQKDWNQVYNAQENNNWISKFIQVEIEKQKAVIKDRATREEPPLSEPEEEIELTSKQIEIIGLFKRSGIIDFLREQNKGITNRQLSKFLRQLTCEHLENSESIHPHLTDNTKTNKHPFYQYGRKDKIDLILNRYNIKPISDV